MITYLKQYREEMPNWLRDFVLGKRPSISQVRRSRCAYYPGAGNDGNLIELCSATQCAHLIIYCDYTYFGNNYDDEHVTFCRGYDIIDRFDMPDLSARNVEWHIDQEELWGGAPNNPTCSVGCYRPEFRLYIYQRQEGLGDEHGTERFAVLLCRYDAIALYDILFGSGYFHKPFIVLPAEHGYGGNYGSYCDQMQRIAVASKSLPDYLILDGCEEIDGVLCPSNHNWQDYAPVPDTEHVIGGMHRNIRWLYKRNDLRKNKHED